MGQYLAFLRGVNVGGNSLVRMAALQEALVADGLLEVRTYIQSGNILFSSKVDDTDALAALIKKSLKDHFDLTVDVAVFAVADWREIVAKAPKWWGKDPAWKHNMLIMIKPYDMQAAVAAIGELKPDIEAMKVGNGVIYQSVSFEKYGQSTFSRIVGKPVYKQITIRNYNTATKLAALLG